MVKATLTNQPSNNIIESNPGDFAQLKEKGSYHWQFGGPEGAILAEVANVHTAEGVKHPNPKME